mmetsp:Transcript_46259/g.116492  ORF Transcript_46259/g.116492 Transcript_46259/m.116492 type:complete len:564 (-) Transcript_46259:44-1735(-)|eukprot:CAMPEP_0177645946 /NCGR_PEP_ID=MMETSP0447-20121125/9517_1 /TAXON_ID=0 /ORGANISM="Stygamoeba regulata, Strain BSH-02190019" /LENGTH=563 /DNA_ID=CAMNT_0019148457 /DNA_START=47 /DNA_END=1738 /DNA_ORIENTATION=-
MADQQDHRSLRENERRKEDAERAKMFGGPAAINFEEMVLGSTLGAGQYGTVQKGTCRGSHVAIKVPKKARLSKREFKQFLEELEIMKNARHPNVCLLMGACYVEGDGANSGLYIVTELGAGDLENLIIGTDGKKPTKKYPLSVRLNWATEAARALAWLHGMKPPILHRDIKLSNILVDQDMRVKVCDFGLSNRLKPGVDHIREKKPRGTPLYMAPEVIERKAVDHKADVYSFAYVLWEMIQQELVFLEYSDFMKFYTDVIKGGKRPALGAKWEPALCDLLNEMWAPLADDRPSMKDVADKLAPIVDKVKHAERVAALRARVPDAKAQRFWMDNFFPESSAKWADFAPAFYKCLGKPVPDHPVVSSALSHSKVVSDTEILDEETRELLCLYELVEHDGLVSTSSLGGVVASFAPLDSGFLTRLVDTLRQPWFFGSIPTKAAEQKLCVQSCGTFLVRFSNSKPGVYCISLVNANKMVQHLVMQHSSQGYRLDTAVNKFWNTVPEFITANASKYKLLEACPGWPFEHLFESQKAGIGGYTAQFDDDMDDDDMDDLGARFDKVTAGI